MLDTSDILALRPRRNRVQADRPYHFLHEQEQGNDGKLKEINTIFLTNSECPFKCVMCDLWKNTLEDPVQSGDVPAQITYALNRLPRASVAKLYNSGNFFDKKAIPPQDYPAIAKQFSRYEHLIIENHPKLCGSECLKFRDLLEGSLEIAMGLETIHPEVLPKLNKQITKANFRESAQFLTAHGIRVRAFILLNPPFLPGEAENIEWTLRSIQFAFDCGADACSIIPTRAGNGAMDKLQREGEFTPPKLSALEEVFERSLRLGRGRVFADLWDLRQFSDCRHCFAARKKRLEKMNLEQETHEPVSCSHCRR